MSVITPPFGETNIALLVQCIRQLCEGRNNATGLVTLGTGGGVPQGPITNLNIDDGGSGYDDGVFLSPLSGGNGTGAIGHVNITAGVIDAVDFTAGGSGGNSYIVGDILTPTGLTGTGTGVATVSTSATGGLDNGVYIITPMTFTGSGTGLVLQVTVAGNTVAAGGSIVVTPGTGYVVGDIVRIAGIPGGGIDPAGTVTANGPITNGQFSVDTITPGGGTTTVVKAPNCSPTCQVFLSPRTAHAAAVEATTYILTSNIKKGQFTITHAVPAFTDQTFGWLTIG